jgi:hypothetical protein
MSLQVKAERQVELSLCLIKNHHIKMYVEWRYNCTHFNLGFTLGAKIRGAH